MYVQLVFLIMLVMMANIETSFPKLRVIKNYLQSTMSQSCYLSLAIKSIEKKITKEINVAGIKFILQKLYLK